ncbi:ankyrin repeat domain-containing protein [Imbroritus primus]|uniref:ankyrin repeat domain-containing protein n=1 Tax=Imbroritus primus TaxID=3058603 RepID=UPI003D162301
MRTPNTNTIYRAAVATPAASGQPVVTMRDFVSFLANPGDLAHGVNRKSPEYLQRREDEFMFFCGHLRGQFGKQLSEEDLKRVTKSARVGWEGSTPLHIAANYRHPDVLRHMLWDNPAAQSALNQTDRLGRTVLDWAMERPQGKNRTEILKILQGYQALRGTSGSAAKTTHRSITPRDIRLSTTGHSGKLQENAELRKRLQHISICEKNIAIVANATIRLGEARTALDSLAKKNAALQASLQQHPLYREAAQLVEVVDQSIGSKLEILAKPMGKVPPSEVLGALSKACQDSCAHLSMLTQSLHQLATHLSDDMAKKPLSKEERQEIYVTRLQATRPKLPKGAKRDEEFLKVITALSDHIDAIREEGLD